VTATGTEHSFGDDSHAVTDVQQKFHGDGGWEPAGNVNEGQRRIEIKGGSNAVEGMMW
jgi:hypothetical protein